MTILYNSKISNINSILESDPGIKLNAEFWGNEHIYEKSSVPLKIFETPLGSINLLYGPRQIGKTSSLKLHLCKSPQYQTRIYIDCSTVLHRKELADQLRAQIEGPSLVILDEVQSVDEWPLAIRALYSEGVLKESALWCTGSEARHVLEGGEKLPGRKGAGKEVFARPWNFREFVEFFFPELAPAQKTVQLQHQTQAWLDSLPLTLEPAWKAYLECGGVPKAACTWKKNNGKISDEVFKTYQDWILGSWNSSRIPLHSQNALAERIIANLNSRTSFERLRKNTDIGSVNTVHQLLNIQEDRWALQWVRRFDAQTQHWMNAKQKKLYPLDPFIARVWQSISLGLRMNIEAGLKPLPLDETGFQAQCFRYETERELAFLYSEKTQSEVDFYFSKIAFELKSNGSPTAKQKQLLGLAPQAFAVRRESLPWIAYYLGEISR